MKLNDAIQESYREYLRHKAGSRSKEKLVPLHGFVASVLQKELGREYEVKSLGHGNDKEARFRGALYDKEVDVAVLRNGKQIGAIAIKFVTRNYSQNATNYIESLLGETFNVRSGHLIYAQMIIIKHPVPYFKTGHVFDHMERISAGRIEKYKKLIGFKGRQLAIPNLLFFALVDTGDSKIYEKYKGKAAASAKNNMRRELLKKVAVKNVDIDEIADVDAKTASFYKRHSNFKKFISGFVALIKKSS